MPQRGKLKIFLGMVAGVGKTCAMLESARNLQAEGKDVVIGFLETHGRKRTQELSVGLERIPRKKITYASTQLEEMDIDGILARKPDLVLVDELAHSNVPGSRHSKRYLDVEEILSHGINVHTTINVQHFESRLDLVKHLSGIEIKESVPDSILDLADQIELIDLPPEELLSRLEKGEIYPKEKVERSLQGFFKHGTLTALRELSLRLTAEKVDKQVMNAVQLHDLPAATKTRDRLLVAIGPSPSATELIRWTRNKAFNLEAPWIAAYVDTGNPLNAEDKRILDQNIELAKHLGAEVITVSEPNVSSALTRIAKEKHVSEVVMGRPQMTFLHKWLAPESPVDALYKEKAHFAVSILTTDKMKRPTLWQLLVLHFHSRPGEYFFSVANVAITTSLLALALPLIGYRGVGLVYLVAVLYQALLTGRGPIYLCAVLSAMSWNFFFIPPRFTFSVQLSEDFIHLILFLVMASVLGSLANRVRAREQAYKEREERASFLFEVSQVFSQKVKATEMLEGLYRLIKEKLLLETSFYLKTSAGRYDFAPEGKRAIDTKEQSVALWCVNNGRRAGLHTETLPHAQGIYFPLASENESFGSIGFYPVDKKHIDFSQKLLLENISRQLTHFLEKQSYFNLRSKNQTLEDSTKLQKALFSSISHELKTPLTSILGSVHALAETQVVRQNPEILNMSSEISASSSRLTHVVEQLLDMSRLESGKLLAKNEWVSLEEALGLVVGKLESKLAGRTVDIQHVAELPLIQADFGLITDVIKNLLHNSIQYADPKKTITVVGEETPDHIVLRFADEGPGVSESFRTQLFQRFSREQPAIPGGLGLGLSICRGFMDAMGGEIDTEARSDGKSGFVVKLRFRKAATSPMIN